MTAEIPPGMVSEEQHQRLVSKYNRLHQLYRDLEQEHGKWRRHIDAANERYRAAKENAKQWQAWIDKHRGNWPENINKRPEVVHLPPVEANLVHEVAYPSADSSQLQRIPSSQTTEDGPEPSTTEHKDASSDGEPEIVSERLAPGRKRRGSARAMPPPVRVKLEPNSQSQPIELASEDYSSPVLSTRKPIRTETSDLDLLVGALDTPRKTKRRRATSEEAAKTATLLIATSSLSEGNIPEMVTNEVRSKPDASPRTSSGDLSIKARDRPHQLESHTSISDALHPISVNVPTSPRMQRNRSNMKRKRHVDMTPAKVAMVSEDGEDTTSQAISAQPARTAASDISRLNALLNEPAPDRTPLSLKRQSPKEAEVQRDKMPTPATARKVQTSRSSTPSEKASVRRPRGLEKSPPPVEPDDEPLRLRPLTTLQLEDFKINPKFMGSDHAFSHTFRGKDQRRCLPGCTKPECCGGAFRKALEIGGIHSTKSDAQVLQEYLGPDYATLMAAYNPAKRKDLLIEARASSFANEHGKHRHAFQRARSPPGFWRVDMPSTQEEEADRKSALEMQREKVEERWREAMRDGGRWMFRDE